MPSASIASVYAGHFTSGQVIIHDHDTAATEGWCEALLNVREESGAVHRSIYYEWGDDPVVAQAGWVRFRRQLSR